MHGGVLEFSLSWWLHEQKPHVFGLTVLVEIVKSVQNKACWIIFKFTLPLGKFWAPDFLDVCGCLLSALINVGFDDPGQVCSRRICG